MNEIDTSFIRIKPLMLPAETGDLLVAQPFLDEQWFDRAVISLIDYDPNGGATGVVLNNSLPHSLGEVLEDGPEGTEMVPVYCGGPLSQDRLFFIHTLGPDVIPDCREYAPGLYIGGDFERAVRYVADGYPVDGFIRFFIGYSGWSRGQLEEEIQAGTWAVVKNYNNADLLDGDEVPFWTRTVKVMGDYYRPWRLIPHDIHAN